jgi:SAM-dependent methyltransferase
LTSVRTGDWFHRLYEGRESFDDKDEEKAYREKQRTLTRPEIEALCRLMRLAPGARVLDAYCGNGRHAIALARRGFEVIGIDVARSRIAFAQNWAVDEDLNASFLVADARDLCLRRAFEAVLILGGSFTHCLRDEENIALLRGLRRVLRLGGLLLIDNPNPLRFWRARNPRATPAEASALRFFDLPLGTRKTSGYVRYYSVDEMKRLFLHTGLHVRDVFGDREGGAYTFHSPRMIFIGQNSRPCASGEGA